MHNDIGKVERNNRTIRKKLRVLCKDNFSDWDKKISNILTSMRFLPACSTFKSPIETIFHGAKLENHIYSKIKSYRNLMKKFHDTKVIKNSFNFNNYEPNQPIKSKKQSLFRDRRLHHQVKTQSKYRNFTLAREVW
ncbi:hypothetical protein A3Q56_05625 [Intoshia linei]|uniref:Integrase catalytic domain-containing protein n=1 Tax=Intoshia linei TaxID=1819745 RepID=A0A177AZ63_9BILA|nr:hypothetical protein A3Q56_05625 [Intoshia linei]